MSDRPNPETADLENVDDLFEPMLPLNSFALCRSDHRAAFLYEFCKVGEPALFEAVNHIWASLEEPREARCIAIGLAAKTGGKGKLALIHVLRACLKEVVTWGGSMPRPEEHASLGDWHRATMAAFAAEREREDGVYNCFAAILGGEPY